MQTEVAVRSSTSTAARWCVVVAAVLLVAVGVVVTYPWARIHDPTSPDAVLGVIVVAAAGWAAVTGWRAPAGGVRRLLLAVVALEMLLVWVLEVQAWTGVSTDPTLISGRTHGLLIMVVPPAYVLLWLVVGILEDRAAA
jgi:hypothetical protein